MELMELMAAVAERSPELEARIVGAAGGPVSRLCFDSREVAPGDLFFCVRGQRSDGHDFGLVAVDAGAVGLVVDHALETDAPQLIVNDVRASMAPMAAVLHEDPSQQLAVVGITGTNGKTTTTEILRAILRSAGRSPATIGTLTGARTTPEAIHLQSSLADLLAEGIDTVALEVSSHALDQHRVDQTWFSVGVFTNLTPEHLDYHGDLETYFAAKAMLFEPDRLGTAVINRDDPYGQRLIERLEGVVPTVTYGRDDATELQAGLTGSQFVWRGQAVTLPIAGLFNVDNALAAAEAALVLGIDPGDIAQGLANLPSVPGRFEVVPTTPGEPTIIVDYAHSPDGLEQLLGNTRALAGERQLITVFGCGGDRDRPKRPLMGRAAETLSDVAIVTSDNPRSEEPSAIIDEILAGMQGKPSTQVEPDRRAAIALALGLAGPESVVVIAGKGHETTQTIGSKVHAFDDRTVARELLDGTA